MTTAQTRDRESLAAEPLDARDSRLLRRVAAHYDAVDPVPGRVVDELVFDISLDAMHVEPAERVAPRSSSRHTGAARHGSSFSDPIRRPRR